MNKPSTPNEKPLNLAKFAPAAKVEAAQTPPEAEGETVFIRRTTASVAETKLQTDADAPANGEFGLPMKEMLGVITYCYARGVFSSGEIAARLKAEPELRKAFGRNLPDEAAVRKFRRKYSNEIEDALETLYQAFPPQDPALPSDPTLPTKKLAQKQAGSRVHDAIWTDNEMPGHPFMD